MQHLQPTIKFTFYQPQVIHSTQNNSASKTNTLMIKLKTNSI